MITGALKTPKIAFIIIIIYNVDFMSEMGEDKYQPKYDIEPKRNL